MGRRLVSAYASTLKGGFSLRINDPSVIGGNLFNHSRSSTESPINTDEFFLQGDLIFLLH